MFHRNIKLIIASLMVAFAIYLFTQGGNTGNGIFLIILSIIPVFLYFKN